MRFEESLLNLNHRDASIEIIDMNTLSYVYKKIV
jgi:hypothetical protein